MDLGPLIPPIGGLCALLCCSAFFSGSETALCALNRVQIERLRRAGNAGNESSKTVVMFVDDPRRLFITILLGNTFVNIAFATTTAVLIYQVLGSGPSGLTTSLVVLVITILLLLFGEITPKTLAIRNPERFAHVVARPLWLFSILITPLRKILRLVTDLLIPIFAGETSTSPAQITGDDIRALVEREDETTLPADEREILGRVLELRETEAHEVMVPRATMVSTTTETTIRGALDLARRAGLSRLPVFCDDMNTVCGFFHVKDWLLWRDAENADQTLGEFLIIRDSSAQANKRGTLVREPHRASQSMNLADLLAQLTREKTKIALLEDDAGDVCGVISVEDIVEEVVGDISDEHDVSEPVPDLHRYPDDPNTIDVAGRIGIGRLNRELGLSLDRDIARTAGEYAISVFGRMPSVGESCTDTNGLHFEVRSAVGQRIATLTVTLPKSTGGTEE